MNISIFGDSITWGASSTSGGWADQLKYWGRQQDEWLGVHNNGIPGHTTQDLLEYFESTCEAQKPELIIVAIGINDAQYTEVKYNPNVEVEEFKRNLEQLLKLARTYTDKIIFVGLTRVDETKTMPSEDVFYYENTDIQRYDEEIELFCKANSVQYVSMGEIEDPKKFEDGLHPDSETHDAMFEIMRSVVEKKVQ